MSVGPWGRGAVKRLDNESPYLGIDGRVCHFRWEAKIEGLRGRLLDAMDGLRDRLDEHGGWLAATRARIRPWYAIPAGVAALTLILGGFWLGGAVGDHASAAVLTSTVKLKGKVITIDGSRFISTPAITVKVKGKTVHIPA